MNDLRTLAFTVAGAIGLSVVYAVAFGGQSIEFEEDKGDRRSVQHVVSGDRGEFELREDDYELSAEWRGDIELNAIADGIGALDHWLEISEEVDGVERDLKFENEDGEIVRRFSIDGEGSDDEEAASALFLRFLRASGVEADDRVSALLKTGSPSDVVTEIMQLRSDNAARRYIVALSENADLSEDNLTSIAERLKKIRSDSELRVSIRALIENETLNEKSAEALMAAAQTIESDHDVRLLIEAFSTAGISPSAWPVAVNLLDNLESDHDFRRASEALFEQDELPVEFAADIVERAAAQVDSDHDMRLILSLSASRLADDDGFNAAWLKALSEIDSDHDRRLALAQAAQQSGLPPDFIVDLIKAASAIDSDHDKRLALERLAPLATDEASIAAYEDALRTIDSDSERDRARDALGQQ